MSCEAWGTDHKKEDQVVIGPTGQMVNTISVYAPGDPGCAAAVVRTETWTYSYVVGPPGPAPGSHDLDLIFQSSVNAVSPPAGGTPSYTLIVLMNADSKLQFGLNDGPPHDESSPAKRPIIGDAFLEFLRQ
jgi:hypothetical protein